MDITSVTAARSMVTEEDFWDKFNLKHNPQFYDKLKKKNKEKIQTTNKKQKNHTSKFKVFRKQD
tara:strand:- start:1 stop:192 length:192 start_codon:yes stop_codon:yes gene_type:complete